MPKRDRKEIMPILWLVTKMGSPIEKHLASGKSGRCTNAFARGARHRNVRTRETGEKVVRLMTGIISRLICGPYV